MSFILDALKKSENDRQRQSGPALFEVRVPPPRSRFPLLAVVIVSLLVVNLGVVAWLMFRKPAEAAPTAQTPVQPAAQPQAAPPQPYVAQNLPAQGQMVPAPGSYPPPAYPNQPPPPNAYGAYGAPPPGAPNAYAQQAPGGYPPPNAAGGAPNSYPAQNFPEPSLDDELPADAGLNPDDFEPAREPQPGVFGRATRGTESGLPTYEEAATKTSLPPLHMDLHSYAADPAKRFVLINMRRLYEGQSSPEGVKVESITTNAAIMSFNGTRFVLDRE